MDEQVVKLKRGWVKNVAIVFLSVMLVLTFFSNTIMNRSLPEVATAFVESGTINAKIRGSGTVTAGESYDVVLSQTRKVESVYVRVGDTVQTGDVLFVLSSGDSDELKQAQDRLDDLRLAYEKSLLNMETADYAQENRNIQKAREALAEAKAELAACTVTDEAVYTAQMNLREGNRVYKELQEAFADAEDALTKAKGNYTGLETQLIQWEEELEVLEEAISDYKKQIKALNNSIDGDAEALLNAAQDDLTDAKRAYAALLSQYVEVDGLATEKTYKEAFESLQGKATDLVGAGASEEELLYQMEALLTTPNTEKKASAEEAAAFKAVKRILDDIADAEARIERYSGAADGALSVEAEIEKLRASQKSAERDADELEEMLDSGYDQLQDLENETEGLTYQRDYLESQVEYQEEAVTSLQEQYDDLQARQADYESAKDRVDSCQDTLDDLIFALAEQKKADGKVAASQQLDLDNALKEIAEQEELVAQLQGESMGSEVTASVSGQISTLNAVAGRDAVAGETLAVIEIVDRGYTVRLPVTNEQAQKVRIGDKASVSNYYWGENLDVTLTQIVNDPSKPGQGKLLVFTLTGDVSSGQNVTLSVGERSASFDAIIPNSALRTDTNGTFVLVLSVKHSPLGNRYLANRVDVNVLAQDDTTAAVSGLSMGDYVITTSSKPLEAGMQVNMVEN